MNPLSILLIDDHALVRAGLRSLLESLDGVQIAGETGDGYEALELIGTLRPDIALLDISMPHLNGLEVMMRSLKQYPHTRIVMVSMHMDQEYIQRALRAGASGYLLKTADRRELELAVRAVARGEVWLSPAVSKQVVAAFGSGRAIRPGVESLTARQREILQLVAEGYSNKEMANRLNVSVKTIDTHRTQLMDRLGIHGTAGLVRCAIRLGIVQAEQ
jgi:DNA-binding NarL/FixJ family response regulator